MVNKIAVKKLKEAQQRLVSASRSLNYNVMEDIISEISHISSVIKDDWLSEDETRKRAYEEGILELKKILDEFV